jgi:hypothetical protein
MEQREEFVIRRVEHAVTFLGGQQFVSEGFIG